MSAEEMDNENEDNENEDRKRKRLVFIRGEGDELAEKIAAEFAGMGGGVPIIFPLSRREFHKDIGAVSTPASVIFAIVHDAPTPAYAVIGLFTALVFVDEFKKLGGIGSLLSKLIGK